MSGDYLAVRDVSKSFGGLKALDGCSFTAARGKVTCLVGPNGAGKTTIFNIVTGFIRPDRGTVSFDGRSLDGLSPGAVIRSGIARTFQNLRLFDEMSVLDNVLVYLRDETATSPLAALFRPFWTAAELRRKTETALSLIENVGLAHKAREPVRSLSYGQQKLLSIARVLATGCDMLLLDEPTSGLSQSALGEMVDMVHKLRDQGHSLLVVEHNTRVVQRIADEIVFLHQGRHVTQGPPEAIMRDPKLAEIYFGGVI